MKEDFMIELKNKLAEEAVNYNILPGNDKVFEAFKLTKYENVKIVILGKEPFANKETANGLAFSSNGTEIPKSVEIIFEELKRSMYPNYSKEQQDSFFQSGDLTKWAKQGIMLLNPTLTVREGAPESHKDIGWDKFTREVLIHLNNHSEKLVFMFWGRKAQVYMDTINIEKHLVLTTSHPGAQLYSKDSPQFVGNGHFYKAIKFLENNRPEISQKLKINILDLYPAKEIMDRIFDHLEKYKTPNELGGDKDDRACTRKEAVTKLLKYEEFFELTNTIDWRTS